MKSYLYKSLFVGYGNNSSKKEPNDYFWSDCCQKVLGKILNSFYARVDRKSLEKVCSGDYFLALEVYPVYSKNFVSQYRYFDHLSHISSLIKDFVKKLVYYILCLWESLVKILFMS